MVKYLCDRCGYSSPLRPNFIKHLNRKYICKSKINDISIEEIKEKYGIKKVIQKSSKSHPKVIQEKKTKKKGHPKVIQKSSKSHPGNILEENKIQKNSDFLKKEPKNEKLFECDYCDKKFKFKQGKSKHMKNRCFKKQQLEKIEKEKKTEYWKKLFEQAEKEKEEIKKEKEEIKKEKEKKEERIDKLVKQIEILLTKVGNNNTTINNTNNIIIRNLGNENISYLSNRFFTKLLHAGPYASIPRIVKRIHFNEKHPENMNLKIKDKNEPFISVFEDNEWKQKDRKETIKEIVHDKFQLIDEKYEEVKDDFDLNKTEIYKSYKERVKKKDRIDSIFEDTENIILQFN